MLPRIEAGEVWRLQNASALIAAVQIARAQSARNWIAVPEDGSAAAAAVIADS